MNKPHQPGFFDVENRTAKLTEMGDPLVGLNAQIDWEAFRFDLNRIHAKARKNSAGAKPTDVVLMFKILVLQQLNNLSDDRIESCRIPDDHIIPSRRGYLLARSILQELLRGAGAGGKVSSEGVQS